jgi:Na+/phosphate symporter
MTPKKKYDERKRLRIERELHFEQRSQERRDKDEQVEAQMISMMRSLERVADVMELWAELQTDEKEPGQ